MEFILVEAPRQGVGSLNRREKMYQQAVAWFKDSRPDVPLYQVVRMANELADAATLQHWAERNPNENKSNDAPSIEDFSKLASSLAEFRGEGDLTDFLASVASFIGWKAF